MSAGSRHALRSYQKRSCRSGAMSSQYIIRVPAQFKVDERTPPKKHVTKMPAKPSMSLNVAVRASALRDAVPVDALMTKK